MIKNETHISEKRPNGTRTALQPPDAITRMKRTETKLVTKDKNKSWSHCYVCEFTSNNVFMFTTPNKFAQHLREYHMAKEGGSYVCKFGKNGICSSLPLEGVSDKDYESHIAKNHVFPKRSKQRTSGDSSESGTSQCSEEKVIVQPKRHRRRGQMFPSPSAAVLDALQTSTLTRKAPDANNAAQPNLLHELDYQKQWDVYSCTSSLTAILNDPLTAKSVSDVVFTKDWGVYFIDSGVVPPSPFIPKVSTDAFESYRTKVSQRASSNHQKCIRSRLFQKETVNVPKTKIDEIVPKMFMKQEFSLEDSENFMTLMSLCKTNDLLNSQTLRKEDIKQLENQLTDYLDVVEEHLACQIARRFRDFFHIMNAMDSVMDQLNKTIKEVTGVRKNCQHLKQWLIKPSLRNIQITKTRVNAVSVYNKVKLMSTVHQTQPTIQLLLSISDYVGALDLISTSQEVVSQELGGLSCFRHLKSQLTEIEKVIDHMMSDEFVKYLNSEWNRPLNAADEQIQQQQQQQYTIADEDLFASIVLGMLRIQRFDFIDTFREEASTAVKTVIKQTVIEALSREDNLDVNNRQELGLFDQLREVEFAKWIALLSEIFDNLELLLKRVKAVYLVMSRTVYDASGGSQRDTANGDQEECAKNSSQLAVVRIVSDTDFIELRPSLNKCLSDVCDNAHGRCASLVESRAREGSFDKISSADFMELAKTIETFSLKCEEICDRRSPNLKLVLQTQANKFASRFHDERRKKLNALLDIEQWKSLDTVSFEIQDIVDHVINKETTNNDFFIFERTGSGNKSGAAAVKGRPYVEAKSQRFVIINSLAAVLNMIVEYCQCAYEIPALSPDLLTRLLDLLKQFNKRVQHLVLGAGACEVAGLKTITARNLIVSLSCLRLTVLFLPRIKLHFEQCLPEKQRSMVKHFDEIHEQYMQHINKIPEKLIAVVKDLMTKNLSKWEAKPPVPSAHFMAISQHLKRLHENIKDAVSMRDLTDLFFKIHLAFKDVLRQRLTALEIVNDNGPQHGLVTMELTFYMQAINELDVAQHLTFSNDDLWSK